MNIASAPANGSEWPVNTTPPTAGGSIVLNFDIYSKLAGTYHSVASMTSDTTPGDDPGLPGGDGHAVTEHLQ